MLMGPVDHHWYRFLDSRYPGSHGAAVAKKVSLDILLYGPVAVVMFYLRECRLCACAFSQLLSAHTPPVMCKLEGKSWREAVAEVKQKFAPTYEVYTHKKNQEYVIIFIPHCSWI